MENRENEKKPEKELLNQGISMSDGKPVYVDPKELYLDKIYNTAADKKDIAKAKGRTMTPTDRKVISVLWVLNALVVAFIGIYLNVTNEGDAYDSIKQEARFESEDGYQGYFSSDKVFADVLTPNYDSVQYPEGMIEGFQPLYSENRDTVAWIRIPDTNIDHVVLQTDNHDDYLRTDFYGDYYIGGSIFMDYRNNVVPGGTGTLSKNTILYGHYLKQQRGMFTELDRYMDVEYYKEHPVIELSTLYSNYKWKIIGAFLAAYEEEDDNSLFYYWYDDFTDEKTLGFANEVAFRSYFQNPSVDVVPSDKFLTLSTCSHALDVGGMVNARFVVVARLVRYGESEEVDVSAAVDNPDRRMPQLWYDLNKKENPYKDYEIWSAF